jgi:uncharacterized protein YciI
MRSALTFAITLLFACSVVAQTQENKQQDPASKLVEFHMAIMKRGLNWSTSVSNDGQKIHHEHLAYVHSLLESGKAIIVGTIKDESDIVAVYIFRAKTADEANSWAMADPAVKAGHIVAEMHPWWSEDIMKKTTTPQKLTTAYLAFLTRGPKWTPQSTPETQEIQKQHLANIQRLADMKKLVVAGPFGDKGTLRGIFVFRVGSLDEARKLSETDPAVQAGRLALDIHPWLVPEGILP